LFLKFFEVQPMLEFLVEATVSAVSPDRNFRKVPDPTSKRGAGLRIFIEHYERWRNQPRPEHRSTFRRNYLEDIKRQLEVTEVNAVGHYTKASKEILRIDLNADPLVPAIELVRAWLDDELPVATRYAPQKALIEFYESACNVAPAAAPVVAAPVVQPTAAALSVSEMIAGLKANQQQQWSSMKNIFAKTKGDESPEVLIDAVTALLESCSELLKSLRVSAIVGKIDALK